MAKRRFLAVLAFLGLAVLALAQTDQTDQTPRPTRLRVSSGVAQGLKTHDVSPRYPKEAREQGIEGDVILQAIIDTKGKITSIRVVEGDPILVAASVEAVKQWKYRPYLLKGEPVEVQTTIKIKFHL